MDTQAEQFQDSGAKPLITRTRGPPINELSTDVFVDIVLLLRDMEIKPDTWHAPSCEWTKLSGVCRSWRSTMINTPALWTSPTVHTNVAFFRLWLQRSQDLPLDVTFHSCEKSKWSQETHMEIVRSIAAPRVACRVRRLALDRVGKLAFDAFMRKFKPSFPLLESMHLSVRKNSGDLVSVTMAPLLRELSLHRISFTPKNGFMGGFKALELGNLPVRLPLDFLLSLLKQSPELEKLVLTGPNVELPFPHNPHHGASITLSKLHMLNLCDDLYRLCPLMEHFANLVVPALTSMRLSHIGPRDDGAGRKTPHDLLPTGDFLSHLKAADSVDIVMTQDTRTVEVHRRGGQMPLLSMNMGPPHYYHEQFVEVFIGEVASRLVGASIQSIKIHADYTRVESNVWCELFRDLPLIERIQVGGNATEAVAALYIALGCSDDRTPTPLPHLEELEIRDFSLPGGWIRPDALEMLVKARASRNAPLKRFILTNNMDKERRLTEKAIDQILEHVGDLRCTADFLPEPLPERLQHVVRSSLEGGPSGADCSSTGCYRN